MHNEESLEVVLETLDPTEVAIIKSLLESAGIPYLTHGEDQYDAFRGAFRGTVFSPHGRPVAFLVPASMAQEARLLLKEGELPNEMM
jgi:putative signal transducing protein